MDIVLDNNNYRITVFSHTIVIDNKLTGKQRVVEHITSDQMRVYRLVAFQFQNKQINELRTEMNQTIAIQLAKLNLITVNIYYENCYLIYSARLCFGV